MLGCGLPGGEQGFNMARVVAVLLWPYLPASSERLLDALSAGGGAFDLSLAGAAFGAGRTERVEKIESLFPKDV